MPYEQRVGRFAGCPGLGNLRNQAAQPAELKHLGVIDLLADVRVLGGRNDDGHGGGPPRRIGHVVRLRALLECLRSRRLLSRSLL
jgi:hypothetical protein